MSPHCNILNCSPQELYTTHVVGFGQDRSLLDNTQVNRDQLFGISSEGPGRLLGL